MSSDKLLLASTSFHGPRWVLSGVAVSLAVVFRFFSALLTPLDHLGVGAACGKVDGGKFLHLLCRDDLPVVGASPVAWTGCLVGTVLSYRHPGDREGWLGMLGHHTGMQGTWTDATVWCDTFIGRCHSWCRRLAARKGCP